MRLKFVIFSKNLEHITFTVFQDGGNCGVLTMQTKAAEEFFNILKCAQDSEELEIVHDWDLLFEIEGER